MPVRRERRPSGLGGGWKRFLAWDGEGLYGGAGFYGGDLAVGKGGFSEWDGSGGEVDGAVDAVEVGEVPEMLPEGLGAPVDIVASGFAAGEVARGEVVVDEGGGDGLVGGEGLGEDAVAEG